MICQRAANAAQAKGCPLGVLQMVGLWNSWLCVSVFVLHVNGRLFSSKWSQLDHVRNAIVLAKVKNIDRQGSPA